MQGKFTIGTRSVKLTSEEIAAIITAVVYAYEGKLPSLLPISTGTAAAKLRLLVQDKVEVEEPGPPHRACQDCGKTGPMVMDTFCPYAQDIHDKEVQVFLCPKCYEERARDI